MHGLPLLQFVAVVMLILANAFFVAAEFALVSVRDTRIEQMMAAGVPGARTVRRLQHELDDFLPAVQLGVTLCSLALGWIGEPLAAEFSWLVEVAAPGSGSCPGLCAPCSCGAELCLYHLHAGAGGRTGAEVSRAETGGGSGGGCRSAHVDLHGDGSTGSAAAEEFGCCCTARLRCADDGTCSSSFTGRTQVDRHRCAPDGNPATVSGDDHSSGFGIGRYTDPRDHDSAPADFLAPLGHAGRGGQRPGYRSQALPCPGLRRNTRPRAHCGRCLFERPGTIDFLPTFLAAISRAANADRPASVRRLSNSN